MHDRREYENSCIYDKYSEEEENVVVVLVMVVVVKE